MKNIHLIDNGSYKNIYITSTEEIKEGDYMFDTIQPGFTSTVELATKETIELFNNPPQGWLKIILTTDENLIANSVQPIDNEFLQWFVNNPDCEEVKVKRGKMKLNVDGEEYGFPDMSLYKIIIPEKESKQVCEHDIVTKYGVAECQNCGIEESEILKDKQMYSEEDMRKAIQLARLCTLNNYVSDFVDLSGLTEICTHGLKETYSEDSIIEQLKK